VGMGGEGMGVTPSWPMEANNGVRGRVCARQKAVEGYDKTDRHAHTQIIHYMMMFTAARLRRASCLNGMFTSLRLPTLDCIVLAEVILFYDG